MSQPDLILKDWEMTKDRIKHFDDVVTRIRLQGIPIATAILAVGLASFPYTHPIKVSIPIFHWVINATSVIMILGSIYLIPISVLDALHYKLLLLSVEHAKQIEQLPKYKGKLQITTILTSPTLTRLHTICAALVYTGVIVLGFVLAYIVNLL